MSVAGPVLLVDDYQSMRRVMIAMLHRLGVDDVDEAADGAAALRLLKDKPYLLIISDCEMRPMTGPQFVKALREQPATAHIPVILVSADGSHDDAAWASGANGLLRKPFSVSTLASKISEVLPKAAPAQEASSPAS